MTTFTQKLYWTLLSIVLTLSVASCGNSESDPDSPPSDEFDVQFTLPSFFDVTKGGEYTFTVIDKKAPKPTDSFILETTSTGVSSLCRFADINESSFSVIFPNDFESGTYRVSIKRDTRKKTYGTATITVVKSGDVKPENGATVYGIISTPDGTGVAGVVVSDGVEVTTTNDKGIYQLRSEKENGYVFMSVPSGYEAASDGVLPRIHTMLKAGASVAERADFELTPVANQDKFKLIVMGDMHLADRTGDLGQFRDFTSDLRAYRSQYGGSKFYGLTLGDMTWDLYWYSRNYSLPNYLNTINEQVTGMQIFHTIGNHDNAYDTKNNYDAKRDYRSTVSPLYYSFNIGKVHFIVMDDIDCSKYDGTTSRNYSKTLYGRQLEWLARDLEHVDKSTPLIITMHAQICKPDVIAKFRIDHDTPNTNQLFATLAGYKVHFITGHTHVAFNVPPSASVMAGNNFYEHNTAAVCASWWWSGHLTPGVHVSLDGAPGGYAIWDIDGTDFQWLYKGTNKPETYQFRAYDLNNVSFSLADVPQMPASLKAQFQKYINAYPGTKKNEVLLNVWNWNPDWTITVTTETGQTLTPTQTWAYDPLHIAALTVKRFNNSSLTSAPGFITESSYHFFTVTAPDAETDLTITVKDEFGHTWIENMQRPKPFSTDNYK